MDRKSESSAVEWSELLLVMHSAETAAVQKLAGVTKIDSKERISIAEDVALKTAMAAVAPRRLSRDQVDLVSVVAESQAFLK